ncbi:Flagellar hook-length control protein FliK [Minicystis rosea]|nr:Flagellar hook-length control protein FliK [Minicystis rosea]
MSAGRDTVRIVCAAAACALLAIAEPCSAQEPPRVSVVAGARGAVAHRLSQELEAAGLSVRVEASESDAAPGALVVVVPAGDGGPIEIWSKASGRSDLVASVPPGGTLDTRVLRASELVRALAFPARAPPSPHPLPAVAPARPEATPARVAVAPARPEAALARAAGAPWRAETMPAPPVPVASPGSFQPRAVTPPPPLIQPAAPRFAFLDVGVALALGVQAPGPSLALDASIRFWPHERVGVGLLAELPVVAARISEPEGSTTFRPSFFGVELVTAPVARTHRVGLVLSPGAGFWYVSASGDARSPYVDHDASMFAAMAYARGELRFRLVDAVHLTAGALGGVALPPVEVRFAGRAVSTFLAHGSFSLGVVLER